MSSCRWLMRWVRGPRKQVAIQAVACRPDPDVPTVGTGAEAPVPWGVIHWVMMLEVGSTRFWRLCPQPGILPADLSLFYSHGGQFCPIREQSRLPIRPQFITLFGPETQWTDIGPWIQRCLGHGRNSNRHPALASKAFPRTGAESVLY